jgi:bis(5'-adenosyl)-triphosphatase
VWIEEMQDCPFCNPSISQAAWLETPDYRVIYNIAPIVPGHSMVIPRKHVTSLLELDDAAAAGLFQTARRAVRVLLAEFRADGFDLSLQDGAAAGQTVPHLHLHLIPRKPGDLAEGQDWYEQILDSRARQRLSEKELAAAVQRLRKRVSTQSKH